MYSKAASLKKKETHRLRWKRNFKFYVDIDIQRTEMSKKKRDKCILVNVSLTGYQLSHKVATFGSGTVPIA